MIALRTCLRSSLPARIARALVGTVVALAGCLAYAQPLVPMPDAGSTTFGDWSFSWEVGNAHDEGLVLKNVRWKGVKVLHKASMPNIRVKYRGDASSVNAGCGPYSDRISSGNLSRFSGQSTDVIARFFGNNLMEIAVFSEIGGYDLYQAYYFHTSGRFEPVLYSSGWSCSDSPKSRNDHIHHPYWRLDFDIDGISNRVRHALTVSGGTMSFAAYSSESGFTVPTNGTDIVWTVTHPNSGRSVRLRSPSNERADAAGTPWFSFGSRDVHVRRYRGSEDVGWDDFSATSQLGYFTPVEVTEDQDLVFWAIGHLSHTWSQADENNPHWHSRGWIIDARW
jgi:hypothetical protein